MRTVLAKAQDYWEWGWLDAQRPSASLSKPEGVVDRLVLENAAQA